MHWVFALKPSYMFEMCRVLSHQIKRLTPSSAETAHNPAISLEKKLIKGRDQITSAENWLNRLHWWFPDLSLLFDSSLLSPAQPVPRRARTTPLFWDVCPPVHQLLVLYYVCVYIHKTYFFTWRIFLYVKTSITIFYNVTTQRAKPSGPHMVRVLGLSTLA